MMEQRSKEISALHVITKLLMHKHVETDRDDSIDNIDSHVGIEGLDRWPLGSDAQDFLRQTLSATSVIELLEVSHQHVYKNLSSQFQNPLILGSWRKEQLKKLVVFAVNTTRLKYKYIP